MAEHHYYKGRPQVHRDHQRSAYAHLIAGCGCLTLVIFALNFLGLIFVASVLTVLLAIVADLLFAIMIRAAWNVFWEIVRDRGSIVPYFKKPTDGSLGDAWLSGQALSRNCEILDGLAIQLGVQPLSSFGFFDDMRGEQVIWHDPKDCLQTISALLRGLDSVSELANERDAVRADLEKMRTALEKAQVNGNQFSLLVNAEEGYISGPEVEQRKGSYY